MLAVFEFLSIYHYQGVYYGKLRPEMLEDVREAPSKCKSVLSWSRLNPKPLQLGWVSPALVDHAHWLSQRKGTSVTLGNLLPSKKTVPGEGNEELGILRGSRTEHPGTSFYHDCSS